jgi:hypothetical protein
MLLSNIETIMSDLMRETNLLTLMLYRERGIIQLLGSTNLYLECFVY